MENKQELERNLNFVFPKGYWKIRELNLIDYDYWHLIPADQIVQRRDYLAKNYPARNLIPFASRYDNDDIACFEQEDSSTVYIVHNFASPGWERRQEYACFWDWFENAIDDMVVRNKEDEKWEEKNE